MSPTKDGRQSHLLQSIDKWDDDHVRMPHSPQNLYIVGGNADSTFKNTKKWKIIEEKLRGNITTSVHLEMAILSYNKEYIDEWNFCALDNYYYDVLDAEGRKFFIGELLPKMIDLALQLPSLVQAPIPLLKRHTNASISLSQLQVASLLTNAFFCTFPHGKFRDDTYQDINFNNLFECFSEKDLDRSAVIVEKLRCILHYFHRVTSQASANGMITIQRRYIPNSKCPKWHKMYDNYLPPLCIHNTGTIEGDGEGLLQVDFANKYIGGGVLSWGCVQEEIRFLICPELLITLLVTEALDDTEALIIKGVEQYSQYEGYGRNFRWMGDFVDDTPADINGHRLTTIVAIDALNCAHIHDQFAIENIDRELNKAYTGFHLSPTTRTMGIATGNWGCGAFRGDPYLKAIIQLMAAGVSRQPKLAYFTFGNDELYEKISAMYSHLHHSNLSIGTLYNLLSQYANKSPEKRSDLYEFLYLTI